MAIMDEMRWKYGGEMEIEMELLAIYGDDMLYYGDGMMVMAMVIYNGV